MIRFPVINDLQFIVILPFPTDCCFPKVKVISFVPKGILRIVVSKSLRTQKGERVHFSIRHCMYRASYCNVYINQRDAQILCE